MQYMPYVSTFLYSEHSTVEQFPERQRMCIVSPCHVFTPAYIPASISFSVLFGILALDGSIRHIINFLFYGPNEGEPPLVDKGDFVIEENSKPSQLPLDMQGTIVNMNFRNIPFKREGTYKSVILVDGNKIGVFPIQVRMKSQ